VSARSAAALTIGMADAILVLNWQDITNPLSGGAEVHLHNIFSRIARLGHEVTLFCSSYAGAPAEEVRDGMRIIRQGDVQCSICMSPCLSPAVPRRTVRRRYR